MVDCTQLEALWIKTFLDLEVWEWSWAGLLQAVPLKPLVSWCGAFTAHKTQSREWPWHEKETGMKRLPSNPSVFVFHLGMCFGKGMVTASGFTSDPPPQGGQLEIWFPKISTERLSESSLDLFVCLACFSVGFSHVFTYLFVMSQVLPSEVGCMAMTNLKIVKFTNFCNFLST